MQNCRLPDGQIVNALEYDPIIHGNLIFCPGCNAEVIHVDAGNRNTVPFFKTTGREKSIHEDHCPEKRQIKQIKTLRMLNEYTTNIRKVNIDDLHVIKVDFDKNDISRVPHGEVDEAGKDNPKKKFDYTLSYSKRLNELTKKITSLSTLAKLLRNNDHRELSKLAFNINGKIVLFNQFVIDQNQAFEIARSGNFYIPYFVVYGKVGSVKKLDKVMFINFDQQDGSKPFAAYIFSGHYKYFTYNKEQLEGNYVLIQGSIKFNEKYNQAEIQIMWNRQLNIMK